VILKNPREICYYEGKHICPPFAFFANRRRSEWSMYKIIFV